jgi:hypothetical protein
MHLIECFYKLIIKASLTPSQVANPLGFYTHSDRFGTIQFYSGLSANIATLLATFFEADSKLLILGEPGAGKTTLLLQLLVDLLKRAEQESTFPMPVLFTLSSWAVKQLSLANWLLTVVTVLRTDQYTSVESFREVGEFVPLQADRHGKVIREVALARFGLPLPEHPGQDGVAYAEIFAVRLHC